MRKGKIKWIEQKHFQNDPFVSLQFTHLGNGRNDLNRMVWYERNC